MSRLFFIAFAAFISIGVNAQSDLPFDFETESTTPAFVDFEQAVTTVEPNPYPSGINTSEFVAKMVRNPGGQIWAGSIVTLPYYLDLSEVGAFKMKVYSPIIGSIMRLKLEGLGVAEIDAITTVSNEWQELEWDFTGLPSGTFNQIAFMLDFGVFGEGNEWSTIYFDDVVLFDGAEGLSQVDLPIDHEDESVHYQTTSFAGNFAERVLDPLDSSNHVMKVTKHWMALDYAGTTLSTPLGLASSIPFAAGATTMTVKVLTPAPGFAVRLKAEEYGDMTHSVETQVNTTATWEWETLTFNMNQPAPGTQPLNLTFDYRILSLFFDFGNPGYLSGTQTFYYDDVSFGDWSSDVMTESSGVWEVFPTCLSAGEPIQVIGNRSVIRVRVYNLLGGLVCDQALSPNESVDTHGWPRGVLICTLEGGGRSQSHKITIAP